MTNTFFTHPHSPSFPSEEEGEWVLQWVPRNTAAPTSQAGTPESQTISTPFTNHFDTMTSLDIYAPTSAVTWDQSPLMDHFDTFYPSSTSPSSSMNELSSQFTNSPAEPILDDFAVDLALLNSSPDLFNNMGLDFDFSEFGLGMDPVSEVVGTLTPSDIISPNASVHGSLDDFIYTPSLAAPTPEVFVPTGAHFTPSPSASVPPPPPAQVFACSDSLCKKTFDKVSDLKRHERKHRQPFRCEICNKGHLDKRALGRHLWAQHPEHAQKTNTRSEQTKCPQCDYKGRADNVARHMKRHSKAKRS
ncbi:hypothetical protein QBC38DRAFT_25845 [Podospora fimiseda]|uniref:C2H2-type domain-containing protein n=1 Tax=Podospora fimiseda TaxID=252190 RepID=A0AAN7BIY9_9PEZI|nr:hypothetical protein QBC38DRAFT_25845 [Podospora fimiseda]